MNKKKRKDQTKWTDPIIVMSALLTTLKDQTGDHPLYLYFSLEVASCKHLKAHHHHHTAPNL